MTSHSLRSLLLAAIIGSFCGISFAADEDFKASTFGFKVYRYSDATKAALIAQGEKRVVRVDVEGDCSMEDFAKVCDHAWIKKLKLNRGAPLITSFEPLAKLTALEELDAASLEASREAPFDLAPLAGLANLESLDLMATKATNFAVLSALTKLEELSLRMTGVDSLDFLKNSPGIESLDLYGSENTFADYRALGEMKNLSKLVIDGNAQATDENLAALSKLAKLKSVSLAGCANVTSLNFLAGSAGSMRSLTMTDCEALADTALLAEMTSLEWLLARGVPFENLSFLQQMPGLKTLNFQNVTIGDLSVFSSLGKLRTAHLTAEHLPEGAAAKLAGMQPEAKFYIK